jgi:hypothetical protein
VSRDNESVRGILAGYEPFDRPPQGWSEALERAADILRQRFVSEGCHDARATADALDAIREFIPSVARIS